MLLLLTRVNGFQLESRCKRKNPPPHRRSTATHVSIFKTKHGYQT